jgi:hypothetical protein
VIGSNSKLTGYAGGIHRKRWLLSHEGLTQNRINSVLLPYLDGPSISVA